LKLPQLTISYDLSAMTMNYDLRAISYELNNTRPIADGEAVG